MRKENRAATKAKAKDLVQSPIEMKLQTAAQWVKDQIDEPLTDCADPDERWI